MKLKLQAASKRRHRKSATEGFGHGKQKPSEELLPTAFQVDTVLGPGVDTSEARRTIPNTAVTPLIVAYVEVLVPLSRGSESTRLYELKCREE